jgi:hypothetical protein
MNKERVVHILIMSGAIVLFVGFVVEDISGDS